MLRRRLLFEVYKAAREVCWRLCIGGATITKHGFTGLSRGVSYFLPNALSVDIVSNDLEENDQARTNSHSLNSCTNVILNLPHSNLFPGAAHV